MNKFNPGDIVKIVANKEQLENCSAYANVGRKEKWRDAGIKLRVRNQDGDGIVGCVSHTEPLPDSQSVWKFGPDCITIYRKPIVVI